MTANTLTGSLIIIIGLILGAFCLHLLRQNAAGDADTRLLSRIFVGLAVVLIAGGLWIFIA